MPSYTQSISFNTNGTFDSGKDDPKVNRLLDDLRDQGATITQIDTHFAGKQSSFTLVYVIHYEAGQAREPGGLRLDS